MGEFVAGLVVGVVAGFLAYPLFWSWIAWREYQQASRRARRIDDVLKEMSRRSD
jgi:H+/Cl- antiporter ClcA